MENPPWVEIALKEVGQAEIPGDGDNPRILEYWTAVDLMVNHDEVAWCSAFANWIMMKAGIPRTRSAAARSWLNWGIEIKPRPGAIVVFKRGREWQGHVGVYMGVVNQRISVLGGNQGDRVCVAHFNPADVLGFRWPRQA